MILRNGKPCSIKKRVRTKSRGGRQKTGAWLLIKQTTGWKQPTSTTIQEAYLKKDVIVEETIFFYESPEIPRKKAKDYAIEMEGVRYGIQGFRDLEGGNVSHFEVDVGGATTI